MTEKADIITNLVRAGFENAPEQLWPRYDDPTKSLDRTKYVSASEIGYCERKAFFGKHPDEYDKTTPPKGEFSYGFAQRGHTAEAWIVEQINRSDAGFTLFYGGKNQRSFFDSTQSGTPDGALVNMRTVDKLTWVVDFKCIDPRTNKDKLPKSAHLDQVLQNTDLIATTVAKEHGWKIVGGLLFYIDASNYEDTREFIVPYDYAGADALLMRADRIMEADDPAQLNPEGVYNGDCDYCPFTHHCNGMIHRQRNIKAAEKGHSNAANKVFG